MPGGQRGRALLEALCYGLRKRGYAVDSTGNGAEAVELCGINDYDLVVLDLNLPGLDGTVRLGPGAGQGNHRETWGIIEVESVFGEGTSFTIRFLPDNQVREV